MFINSLCLLLIAGVQCCSGFEVPHAKFGPLNQWELMDPIKEIHHDTPQTYIFEDDAVLKILQKSQTSILIREYEDATNNFFSTDKSHSLNNTAINNVFDEKPSRIILVDKFKDKIERVINEIDKVIVTLAKNNDIQRSKRSAVTSTSPAVPTHFYYSSKLAELENNIRKMTENIVQLKKSESLTNEDKERFSTLEERVSNLDNLIDNQSRGTDEEIDKVKSTMENLSNSMSSLNTEFLALEQKIAEQEEKKLATIKCIDDIQSHNFEAADAKLSSISDKNKINLIVHQVYSNAEAHFSLLVEFGDSIRNVKRSYLVYKALNYEMESNRHRDPYKLIRLIKSLRNKIIHQQNIAINQEAESLVSNIINTLKITVKDKLREGMLNDRYDSVAEIAKATCDFDDWIYSTLIAEVIREVYGNVSIEQLIRTIPNESRYEEQAVPAYFALLGEMKSHGEFSTHAIFKIAYRIKNRRFTNVNNLLNLKRELPVSVRNAVFASKVCIKNAMRGEYLYSARVWGQTYDNYRGYVYTWISGAKVREADWIIEPDGDNFYIKNDFRGEYLYSARPFARRYNWDRGFVFTWIPGNKKPDAAWKLEPYGDNCYIKNVLRNEYLYSARMWGQTYDKDRGYVFTWIPGSIVSSAGWKIEDCS